ncbi:hypothetical protein Tco_0912961 [Tanacetum coccineum]
MPLSTYLNLGLGELAHTKLTVELAYKTVKYPKGITENVLVDDPWEDNFVYLRSKIDCFKRKILRRDQVDDLMPTIEEGKVVEEFRARNDARMVSKFFGYPSDCDHDKKIHIDFAYNLKFSCMIDFAVLENMDAYRDEGMGDVIFGEPFLREVGINAKRFEGMITIHNGNDEVTYQMVRSHPRYDEWDLALVPKAQDVYQGGLDLGPNMSEMRRWKNGSHAGTLACMRWSKEAKEKSNLKTSLTSLKEKKSTMLVENLRSGNFEVLES